MKLIDKIYFSKWFTIFKVAIIYALLLLTIWLAYLLQNAVERGLEMRNEQILELAEKCEDNDGILVIGTKIVGGLKIECIELKIVIEVEK